MGYGNLNVEKQREKDRSRIRELEEQLKRERSRSASSVQESQPPSSGHVTVERTSKKLKRQLLLSWIACIGGFCISCCIYKMSAEAKDLGYSTSSYSTVASIFLFIAVLGLLNVIVTKINIWWNHG